MAPWDFLFDEKTYKVGKNGVSPIQNMAAYLGGSAIQTVGDNPVTAYRQLVQQYAKNLAGETVAPPSPRPRPTPSSSPRRSLRQCLGCGRA